MNQNCVQNMDTFWYISTEGDSNEAKIRVAEYSTILFQQGQPSFVLYLKQISNFLNQIKRESSLNQTGIERESNVNCTFNFI